MVFTLRDEDGRARKFLIPYRECVEQSESTLILGDAFFRRWLVLHDLSDLDKTRVGLAAIRPGYEFAVAAGRRVPHKTHVNLDLADESAEEGSVARVLVEKLPARRRTGDHARQRAWRDDDFIINDDGEIIGGDDVRGGGGGGGGLGGMKGSIREAAQHSSVLYTVEISVGTPPQRVEVIFDTGSYMLAVFAAKPGQV